MQIPERLQREISEIDETSILNELIREISPELLDEKPAAPEPAQTVVATIVAPPEPEPEPIVLEPEPKPVAEAIVVSEETVAVASAEPEPAAEEAKPDEGELEGSWLFDASLDELTAEEPIATETAPKAETPAEPIVPMASEPVAAPSIVLDPVVPETPAEPEVAEESGALFDRDSLAEALSALTGDQAEAPVAETTEAAEAADLDEFVVIGEREEPPAEEIAEPLESVSPEPVAATPVAEEPVTPVEEPAEAESWLFDDKALDEAFATVAEEETPDQPSVTPEPAVVAAAATTVVPPIASKEPVPPETKTPSRSASASADLTRRATRALVARYIAVLEERRSAAPAAAPAPIATPVAEPESEFIVVAESEEPESIVSVEPEAPEPAAEPAKTAEAVDEAFDSFLTQGFAELEEATPEPKQAEEGIDDVLTAAMTTVDEQVEPEAAPAEPETPTGAEAATESEPATEPSKVETMAPVEDVDDLIAQVKRARRRKNITVIAVLLIVFGGGLAYIILRAFPGSNGQPEQAASATADSVAAVAPDTAAAIAPDSVAAAADAVATPAPTVATPPPTPAPTPAVAPKTPMTTPAATARSAPAMSTTGQFTVHVESFGSAAEADRGRGKWRTRGYPVLVWEWVNEKDSRHWFRLGVGRYATESEAQAAKVQLKSAYPAEIDWSPVMRIPEGAR